MKKSVNINNTARLLITLLTVLTFSISIISCKKKQVKDEKTTNNNETGKEKELPKEYRKEGFISKSLFRIIIVEPRESCPGIEEIEKTAKRRAFMSLQKYLASRNKTINQNTRAKLLNLINQNGKISKPDYDGGSRELFIFEIKKDNLIYDVNQAAAR